MILVAYTTRYRTGGRWLARAAHTLAAELPGEVRCVATEDKASFVAEVTRAPLSQLHFVGHAGLYGPMFGTTALAEQLSPHEWRQLPLRFTEDGQAFFHACRTGVWFAPFFARTFGVPAWGHGLYTTFSQDKERYRRVRDGLPAEAPVYVVGQPGRASHGLPGTVGKHLGWLPPVPMTRFAPHQVGDEATYERVATAYDRVFDDIRVRGPEWTWLSQRVASGSRVLELGCGTGALLRALRPRLARGVGVDSSAAMLARARAHEPEERWLEIEGPVLPVQTDSQDLVISLLSWRYLDWDPMLAEVVRVLRPGGRLLVVDMAASPARTREWPRLLAHQARARAHTRRFPRYGEALRALVDDPAWATMLRYNPMRAEHEYRFFFESRFPPAKVEVLDIGLRSRILAFDSGPVDARWLPPQSYP